jgi:microcystin-dependent protein
MSEPFIAEVRIVGFNFAPRGWATCDGQLLPINQNQALFSLLGTLYGGNGFTTFALPDLRGRTAIHAGDGSEGQSGGEEAHTLAVSEIPAHTHNQGSYSQATTDLPTGNAPASKPRRGVNAYSSGAGDVTLRGSGAVGGGQPHNNLQPYLVLNFVIALVGVFPSRN